ncbi:MAG: hypothetical protein ABJI60_15225 [Kangiellaceae bacterium]
MIYKLESTLTSYSYSVYLALEGNDISLSYDGNEKYKSSDLVDIGDSELDVFLRVNGMNGTDWSILILVTKPSDSTYKEEYKKSGEIESRGTIVLSEKFKLT